MINTGFLPPLQQSSTRKCKMHHAIYFSQLVNQIAGIQITEGNGSALKESFLMESSYTYCLWGNLKKKQTGKSNVVAILLRCCSVGADPRHYVPNKTVITFQSRRLHTVRRCLKRLNHWASESPLLVPCAEVPQCTRSHKAVIFWMTSRSSNIFTVLMGEKHWMCSPEREPGPLPLYDMNYASPTLGCNLFITWNRLSVPFFFSPVFSNLI